MPPKTFYGRYPVVGLGVTTIVSHGISGCLFVQRPSILLLTAAGPA